MKTKVERLVEFVNPKFGLNLDPSTFNRVRAGYWQRARGAWSWWMYEKERCHDIGSQHSITRLLKNKDNIMYDNSEFDLNNW